MPFNYNLGFFLCLLCRTMNEELRPSMLSGIFMMRCPSCRRSPMYVNPNPYHWKSMGDMHQICPKCSHAIDQEAGYFVGAMYFSYAMMVAWNFSIAVGVYLITGQLFDNFKMLMALGIISSIIISPVVFRYSRVLWSYTFFKLLKK